MSRDDSVAMSSHGSAWVPRRDLTLPNELLHKIIILLIADCVHTVCMSHENPLWEKTVLETLNDVSPVFRAISCEIAGAAFDVPLDIRDDDRRVQQIVRAKFVFLRHLRDRYGEDSVWHSTFNQTLDAESHDPFVFSYAKYLGCVFFRRSLCNSFPGQLFAGMHSVVLTSLEKCDTTAQTVYPHEITTKLRESIASEIKLAHHSVALVQAFTSLKNHANSMSVLYPCRRRDGSGPVSALYYLISSSLGQLEEAYEGYADACLEKLPEVEPNITQFPDAIAALRGLYVLEYTEDDMYGLGPRIRSIIGKLSLECPYLGDIPLKQIQDDIATSYRYH